jgi:hypothetical protein
MVTAYSSWIFTISLYLSPLASNYMFLLSIVFNYTIKFFITFSSFMFVSSSNLNAFEKWCFFCQLFNLPLQLLDVPFQFHLFVIKDSLVQRSFSPTFLTCYKFNWINETCPL